MGQALSRLYIQLIFNTKGREPMLLRGVHVQMHAYLGGVLNRHDCPAIRVGSKADHVHALFRLSKNCSLAEVVEEVKTGSSRWIKTRARGLGGSHWQAGYGGFSVSAGICMRSRSTSSGTSHIIGH